MNDDARQSRRVSQEDVEVTTVKCEFCGHEMTPFSPIAKAHICRECLEDIQVGDRYTEEA